MAYGRAFACARCLANNVPGRSWPCTGATRAHLSALTTMTNLLLALALARIIAGEAPGCDMTAKLAVAHVHSRNAVWFGDAEPTATDLYIALHWQEYDDPTGGAVYLIHPDDRARMPWLEQRTAVFTCLATRLEAWN